jgi:hypothetical protein
MKNMIKRAVVMLTVFTMLCTTIPVKATSGIIGNDTSIEEISAKANAAIQSAKELEEQDTSERDDLKSTTSDEANVLKVDDTEKENDTEKETETETEKELITVEPGEIIGLTEVYVGSSVTLTGTVGDTTSANDSIESWTADDPSLVSIDENEHIAVVTGVSEGTTTITHTYFVKDPNADKSETAAYLTMKESITMEVKEAQNLNHYLLNQKLSSNITVYATAGSGSGGLTMIYPGQEFVTEDPNSYYFVRVLDGYAAKTSFTHTYVYGDPSRTEYPVWDGGQYAIYHEINDATYNMPQTTAAKALGCTYKFQYTLKSGDNGNFWAQVAIVADPIEISVVYDANGGTDAPVDSKTYYHENVTEFNNHEITITTDEPTYEGKTFGGWRGSDGVIYHKGDTIPISSIWDNNKALVLDGTKGTFTLTAVWEKNYSVSYKSNGATSGDGVVDMTPYKEGDQAEVQANTWLRYGYYFAGWNTDPEGEGTAYTPGDMITLDSNVVLYAQWSKQPTTVVTLQASSATFKYDGTEHTVSGFDGVDSNNRKAIVVNGKTYYLDVSTMSAKASGTDAGTTTTTITGTYKIYDESGNDVTDEIGSQIKIDIVYGTLTITQRNITLTSKSVTEEYSEGKVLTAPEVQVGGDGFVTGEGCEYVFSDSAKVSTPNTSVLNEYSYNFNDGTNPLNYNITKLEGTLTLTAPPEKVVYTIQVEAGSASYVYDGTEHTVDGFKQDALTFAVVVDGETQVFTVTGLSVEAVTAKDAGTYPVNITGTAVVTDKYGNDVSDQFIIDPKAGTLTITPRPVMLRSDSAQKVYDGTPLTAENVTDSYNVSGSTEAAGFVGGDSATYTFTGTQTIPGASENTFTYELSNGTKAGNYKISVDYGTLNVQHGGGNTIALQPISKEVVYNGTEQTAEGFEQTTFTFNGQEYTVTGIEAIAKGTNPGVYQSSYSGTPVVLDSDGNDVTSEFNIDLSAVGVLRIKGVYTVTINYVDTAGRTLAPSHEERFVEGATFGPIVSPTIEGYTPNFASVSSPGSGMPNVDITVNVVYTANPIENTDTEDNDNTGSTPETTPEATTPEETTPEATTPEETTPEETTPEATTPEETTPEATTPEETTPGTTATTPGTTNETPGTNAATPEATNETPGTTTTPGTTNVTPAENTPAATVATTTNAIAAIPVTLAANGEPEEDLLIVDEETPMGVISVDEDGNAEIINIEDDPTALASGAGGAAWALINLIAAILTAVICIILLISLFKRNKDEEDEDDKDKSKEDEEDEEKKKKQRFIAKLLSIIPAAAAIIIFLITENMKNPMRWVDKWTILMLIILLVQIILAFFASRKKKKDKDDEDKEEK